MNNLEADSGLRNQVATIYRTLCLIWAEILYVGLKIKVCDDLLTDLEAASGLRNQRAINHL